MQLFEVVVIFLHIEKKVILKGTVNEASAQGGCCCLKRRFNLVVGVIDEGEVTSLSPNHSPLDSFRDVSQAYHVCKVFRVGHVLHRLTHISDSLDHRFQFIELERSAGNRTLAVALVLPHVLGNAPSGVNLGVRATDGLLEQGVGSDGFTLQVFSNRAKEVANFLLCRLQFGLRAGAVGGFDQ